MLVSTKHPLLDQACSAFLMARYVSSSDMVEKAALQLAKFQDGKQGHVVITPFAGSVSASGDGAAMGSDTVDQSTYHDGVAVFRIDVAVSHLGALASRRGTGVERASGISLYTLLNLGATAALREALMKMLLQLPTWAIWEATDKECTNHLYPWNMVLDVVRHKNVRVNGTAAPAKPFAHRMVISHEPILHGTPGMGTSVEGVCSGESSANDEARMGAAQTSTSSDTTRAKAHWNTIANDMASREADWAGGAFSLLEHGAGTGHLSALIASSFPNATVVSVEEDEVNAHVHLSMLQSMGVENNVVCVPQTGSGGSGSSRSASSGKTPPSGGTYAYGRSSRSYGSSTSATASMSYLTDASARDHAAIVRNIYDSPELFKFQLLGKTLLNFFLETSRDGLKDWGATVGSALSSAVTSYVESLDPAIVSLAMEMAFESSFVSKGLPGPYRSLSATLDASGAPASNSDATLALKLYPRNSIQNHPVQAYRNFDILWLLGVTRAPSGSTQIKVDRVRGEGGVPLLRADVYNMTRHVHHHYDYKRDGHTRTYTMHVLVNETETREVSAIVDDVSRARFTLTPDGVRLTSPRSHKSVQLSLGQHPSNHKIISIMLSRDRDAFFIPYTAVHGVTLISVLRMGMAPSMLDKLYKKFLSLPLYEDMAPWNVVLTGAAMDYIDFDTRGITYNEAVPQAYQVMTVLMNYERSIKDFNKCGSKASTVYGLPYVSDCVGDSSTKTKKCPELAFSVPCADGECHSDYISCLKSINAGGTATGVADTAGWSKAADEALASQLLQRVFNASMLGTFSQTGLNVADGPLQ